MNSVPFSPELSREEVDALPGSVLLEFGVDWCPHCQAAQPLIADALRRYPQVHHLRLEDGKGKRLGRSFAVKVWPALIFMSNGLEVVRVVRPTLQREVDAGFAKL